MCKSYNDAKQILSGEWTPNMSRFEIVTTISTVLKVIKQEQIAPRGTQYLTLQQNSLEYREVELEEIVHERHFRNSDIVLDKGDV